MSEQKSVGDVATSGWQSMFMVFMGVAFLGLYILGDYLAKRGAI